MWKKFLFKFGYFLFQLGTQVLIQVVLGKGNRQALEQVIRDLSAESDLTAKQKYNRAKKFLDSVATDIPETLKNLAIEAIVAKVTDKAEKALQKVQ